MPVPSRTGRPVIAGATAAFPPNLLVNADDFGLDPRISLAIVHGVREGLIHSLSAVPFRDAYHGGLLRDLLRDCPHVKVGVHLCLVEFPYLAPEGSPTGPGRKPPADFREFLGHYLRGKVGADWLRREWRAQIDCVASHLGGVDRLAHLDSHQNLHVLPGLWQAARRLQQDLGIPRLRVPYESLGRGLMHRFPFGFALQALSRWRDHPGASAFIGFFTSTAFTVDANRKALRAVAANPGRSYELMVHPALALNASGAASEAEALDAAAAAAFRSRIKPSQEREMDELRKLGEFYRA